jgi:hypothetical protein
MACTPRTSTLGEQEWLKREPTLYMAEPEWPDDAERPPTMAATSESSKALSATLAKMQSTLRPCMHWLQHEKEMYAHATRSGKTAVVASPPAYS